MLLIGEWGNSRYNYKDQVAMRAHASALHMHPFAHNGTSHSGTDDPQCDMHCAEKWSLPHTRGSQAGPYK